MPDTPQSNEQQPNPPNPTPNPEPSPETQPQPQPKPNPTPTTEPQPKPQLEPQSESQPPEAFTLESLGDNLSENFDAENPLIPEFVDLINNADMTPQQRGEAMFGLYGKVLEQVEAHDTKAWLDLNDQWQQDLVKQFGGEAGLDQQLAKVSKLIDAYAADRLAKTQVPAGTTAPDFAREVRDASNLTGTGNNPAIVNMLIWAADRLSEGAPLSGSPSGGEQTRAQKLFGGT